MIPPPCRRRKCLDDDAGLKLLALFRSGRCKSPTGSEILLLPVEGFNGNSNGQGPQRLEISPFLQSCTNCSKNSMDELWRRRRGVAEGGKLGERECLGAPGGVDAQCCHVLGAEQTLHVIAQGLAAAGKGCAHHLGE